DLPAGRHRRGPAPPGAGACTRQGRHHRGLRPVRAHRNQWMDGGLELTGTLPATSRISLPLLTGEVEQTTPDSRNKSDSSVADPDGRVGGWRVPRPWLRRARLTRGRGRGRCRRSRGEPRRPASVAVYALAAMAIRNPALVLACGVMGLPVRVTTSRRRRHPAPILSHLTWSTLMLRFLPPLFSSTRTRRAT